MWKVCTVCNYFGKGVSLISTTNPLWPGLLLGIGLMLLGQDLYNSVLLSQIASIIFIPAGILGFIDYFVGGSTCPICNNASMKKVKDSETQKLFQKGSLCKHDSVCISCQYKSTLKNVKAPSVLWSAGLVLFGILGALFHLESNENSILVLLNFVGYLVVVASGIYGLYLTMSYSTNCPKCGEIDSMIPIYTPRAKEILRQDLNKS